MTIVILIAINLILTASYGTKFGRMTPYTLEQLLCLKNSGHLDFSCSVIARSNSPNDFDINKEFFMLQELKIEGHVMYYSLGKDNLSPDQEAYELASYLAKSKITNYWILVRQYDYKTSCQDLEKFINILAKYSGAVVGIQTNWIQWQKVYRNGCSNLGYLPLFYQEYDQVDSYKIIPFQNFAGWTSYKYIVSYYTLNVQCGISTQQIKIGIQQY